MSFCAIPFPLVWNRKNRALAPLRDDGRSPARKAASIPDWTVAHDFAFDFGGAERITKTARERVFDHAPLLVFGGRDAVLQRMGVPPAAVTRLAPGRLVTPGRYRHLTPLYPAVAAARPAVDGNLFACSYGFAHHLRAKGATVVYCLTPLRQVWSGRETYAAETGGVLGLGVRALGPALRRADVAAARRADAIIAESTAVRDRVRRFYGRDASVVFPPVDTERFRPVAGGARSGYVWIGRIVEPYKRVTALLAAFEGFDAELTVVGDGRDRARLERSAPPNVRFVGELSGEALTVAYRSAAALLFPSEDDFGIVPVEAMASGTPVIALRRGGALDTVSEGVSGVFFDDLDPESIRRAVRAFEAATWDEGAIVAWASRFGVDRFVSELRAAVEPFE